MTRRVREFSGLTLFLSCGALIVGCRYIEVEEGEATVSPSIRTKYEDVHGWLSGYDTAKVPAVRLREGTRRVLSISPDGSIEKSGAPDGPSTVLTFVQISDVQLRDERVKLGGNFFSKVIDLFVPVNEYGEEQQRFDSSVYLPLIKGINKLEAGLGEGTREEKQEKPLFVVHTGDSVHAGVLQELYEFIWITNRLELPWLQVTGNHDITAFGTELFEVHLKAPRLGYLPLYDSEIFRHLHGHEQSSRRRLFRPGIYLGPALQNPHDKTEHLLDVEDHGFELATLDRGYYSIVADQIDQDHRQRIQENFKVRFIFFDTTEDSDLHRGGFREMGVQVGWLRDQLRSAADNEEHVVAFGHHDFYEGFREGGHAGVKVARMLGEYPLFLGYFCGHTHRQEMRVVSPPSPATAFWEVIAPSVLEWPQAGLLVRLVRFGDGSLAWDITPFSCGFQRGAREERLDPEHPDPTERLRAQAILGSESAYEDCKGDPDKEIKEPPFRLLIPTR